MAWNKIGCIQCKRLNEEITFRGSDLEIGNTPLLEKISRVPKLKFSRSSNPRVCEKYLLSVTWDIILLLSLIAE